MNALPQPHDPWAIKRGLGRCWGYSIGSFGLWGIFWLFTYRRLLDREIGDGRDDAVFHTIGMFIPILNFFVLYWLWRDLDYLRKRIGLGGFPAGPYVFGSIFLAPVFYSLVNQHLNEYWDVRSQGYARDAPTETVEKILLAVGIGLFALYLLVIVLSIVLAVVAGTTS